MSTQHFPTSVRTRLKLQLTKDEYREFVAINPDGSWAGKLEAGSRLLIYAIDYETRTLYIGPELERKQ